MVERPGGCPGAQAIETSPGRGERNSCPSTPARALPLDTGSARTPFSIRRRSSLTVDLDIAPHPNKVSWEKGDFRRNAATSRKSGEEFVASLGITAGRTLPRGRAGRCT